jgi:thiamine biosynthesis lipoprotein
MEAETKRPARRRVGLPHAAFLCCAALSACAPEPTVRSFGGATMGTTYNVQVVVDPVAEATDLEQVASAVSALLVDVNARFSTYQSDSLISRLNRAPAGEAFPVDDEFLAVL